jgi:hypothetical protein
MFRKATTHIAYTAILVNALACIESRIGVSAVGGVANAAEQVEFLAGLSSGWSSDPELVRRVQAFLKERGFDPGLIDGRIGPKTKAAIQAWSKTPESSEYKALLAEAVIGTQRNISTVVEQEIAKADSVKELEALIKKYADHEMIDKVVEKLEIILIDEVRKTKGHGRYIISGISAQENASPMSITFQGVDRKEVLMEFAHDSYPMRISKPHPFSDRGELTYPRESDFFVDGSVHRYNGKTKALIDGKQGFVIGEGDRLHRLTFGVVEGVGYVYLRGRGKVIVNDEIQAVLGAK